MGITRFAFGSREGLVRQQFAIADTSNGLPFSPCVERVASHRVQFYVTRFQAGIHHTSSTYRGFS